MLALLLVTPIILKGRAINVVNGSLVRGRTLLYSAVQERTVQCRRGQCSEGKGIFYGFSMYYLFI